MELLSFARQQLQRRIERRREPRMFGSREVIVKWRDPEEHIGLAVVKDWNRSGLRIDHSLPLRTDDAITVITPQVTLHARVVWVEQQDGERHAGLAVLGSEGPLRFKN